MTRYKTREVKEFLISQRKKIGPGYLNTPMWIVQKAGKRIWNKSTRHWRDTEFGNEYRRSLLDKADQKQSTARKSGNREKRVKFTRKRLGVKTRNTTIVPKKYIKKKRVLKKLK
ncbi:MAG: hypothetical protein V1824_00880 [archaeon]